MLFEWDSEKEKRNIRKHGLSFSVAALVFHDENRLEAYDHTHSLDEDRFITIGRIQGTFPVITVVYTVKDAAIRIISARTADKREEEKYYAG